MSLFLQSFHTAWKFHIFGNDALARLELINYKNRRGAEIFSVNRVPEKIDRNESHKFDKKPELSLNAIIKTAAPSGSGFFNLSVFRRY